jgi:bacterioferritin-associated ferredoxin
MYVCICNAIRECELRKAARASRGDAEALYASLGRPPQCRQCIDDADDIVADERLATQLPMPMVVDRTFQPMHP